MVDVNLFVGIVETGVGALLIVVSFTEPMGGRHAPRWSRWVTRAVFVAAGAAVMLGGMYVAGL